jgi:hypothetical protein
MTGVYSGGLVYEYSEESSNYGLVKISGDKVTTLKDYDALKAAFDKTNNPSGDGQYNATGGSNPCPKKNAPNWAVSGDALPAIPKPAEKYLKNGAGKGEGFSGSGSQNAGTTSTGTATSGSGEGAAATGTGGAAATSSGAAFAVRPATFGFSAAPIAVSLVTAMSTLVGAGMILL